MEQTLQENDAPSCLPLDDAHARIHRREEFADPLGPIGDPPTPHIRPPPPAHARSTHTDGVSHASTSLPSRVRLSSAAVHASTDALLLWVHPTQALLCSNSPHLHPHAASPHSRWCLHFYYQQCRRRLSQHPPSTTTHTQSHIHEECQYTRETRHTCCRRWDAASQTAHSPQTQRNSCCGQRQKCIPSADGMNRCCERSSRHTLSTNLGACTGTHTLGDAHTSDASLAAHAEEEDIGEVPFPDGIDWKALTAAQKPRVRPASVCSVQKTQQMSTWRSMCLLCLTRRTAHPLHPACCTR